MDQGPKPEVSGAPRDPAYKFPNYKYPTILEDGRRISLDGEGLPITSILTKDNVKPAGAPRFSINRTLEQLFPGKTKAELSGYDRGHIHADMHNGRPDLNENFIPVLAGKNRGAMRDVEEQVRDLALQGNQDLIVMRGKMVAIGIAVMAAGFAIAAPFIVGYMRYRKIPVSNASSSISDIADFEFEEPNYYKRTYVSNSNGIILCCSAVKDINDTSLARITIKSYEIVVLGQVRYRILHSSASGESVQFQPW